MSTDERLRRLTRKLREELGDEICDALDDPTVIEIVVNDVLGILRDHVAQPIGLVP